MNKLQIVRNFLEKFDFYLMVRFSDFYLKHVLKCHYSVNPLLQKEKEYYLSLLSGINKEYKVIFDIGANEGFISYFLLEEKFKVFAIEPDDRNQRILLSRFSNNNLFNLIPKAVSNKEGFASLFIHKRNSALNTFSTKWKKSIESKEGDNSFLEQQNFIELTTLDVMINERGRPAFIKIDVEGHELEVINGLNKKVPLLSFEANFPEFKKETFLIIEKLETIDKSCKFNYSLNFQLEFSQFVSGKKLEKQLRNMDKKVCIEVICQMSNYVDFYKEGG